MIVFNIKCKSPEEMFKLREKMHLGLTGSPAYVNSEIAICDLQDDAFSLVIANSNDYNQDYDLQSENMLER